jgi:ABC-type glycerol-3-phosphate transport system substrate-binding protein
VPYLDTGYPQIAPHDILANVQSMAAGKMSPADFLKSTQAGWAAFHNYK